MQNIIYYFSGTGNSLYAAKKIKQSLEPNTEVIHITSKLCEKAAQLDVNANRLGFVFPVYAYGPPLLVVEFLKQLNIQQADYFFAVAVDGGYPGNTLKRFEATVLDKGLHVDSAFYVTMPGNYIPEHDVPSAAEIQTTLQQAEVQLDDLIDVVKHQRTTPVPIVSDPDDPYLPFIKQRLVEQFGELNSLVDLEAINASNDRYEIFQAVGHVLDTQFYVNAEACTGCDLCGMLCPVENIVLNENKIPVWQQNCEFCLACLNWCPEHVIDTSEATKTRGRYKHPEVKAKELLVKSKAKKDRKSI